MIIKICIPIAALFVSLWVFLLPSGDTDRCREGLPRKSIDGRSVSRASDV